MIDFTSESKPPFRPLTIVVTLVVFAVGLGGVLLYSRFQRNSQPPTNGGAIIVPGMVRPGEQDFEYYKNKIRIENVRASLGITFSQARIAIISGIIANEGDRKLEAIELHIALFDAYGKPSKDRTTVPIRPGIGLSRPMVPLEKRAFTVGIESVEQFWSPKKLVVEITGLKYQ